MSSGPTLGFSDLSSRDEALEIALLVGASFAAPNSAGVTLLAEHWHELGLRFFQKGVPLDALLNTLDSLAPARVLAQLHGHDACSPAAIGNTIRHYIIRAYQEQR